MRKLANSIKTEVLKKKLGVMMKIGLLLSDDTKGSHDHQRKASLCLDASAMLQEIVLTGTPPPNSEVLVNEIDAVVKEEVSKLQKVQITIPIANTRMISVLIVDDVRSCRKMLARVLTINDCVCDEAGDGLEAVEKVRAAIAKGECYDGIFMDASMPLMTGSEATKAIRNMGCRCKIYGVTGDSLPEDISRFTTNGADDVFIKPLRKDDILDLLQRTYPIN
jgi:CheY-like chemotaxis protein